MVEIAELFPRKMQEIGVLQKGIYLTLKHLQRKTITLMLRSCLSPELRWQMSMSMSMSRIYISTASLRLYQKQSNKVVVHAKLLNIQKDSSYMLVCCIFICTPLVAVVTLGIFIRKAGFHDSISLFSCC